MISFSVITKEHFFMIPRYNSTTSANNNSNATNNSQSQNNKKTFTSLRGLPHISFENGNLLYENESEWHLLGFVFIFIGVALFFNNEWNMFISILVGMALIIIGFSCLKLIESFSILNVTMNTIYKELRFNSIAIYKSKSINIKDIALIGVDHKRINPKPDLPDPKEYNTVSFVYNLITALFIGYIFYKKEAKKESSMVDGRVEASAIAFLTNDGKINYFNPFSDKVNAEKNNIKLAEAIGLYTNLPVTIAKNDECLEVTRMGSKLKFTSKSIKPSIGGTFLQTLAFALLGIFLVILFFVLLVKFI